MAGCCTLRMIINKELLQRNMKMVIEKSRAGKAANSQSFNTMPGRASTSEKKCGKKSTMEINKITAPMALLRNRLLVHASLQLLLLYKG